MCYEEQVFLAHTSTLNSIPAPYSTIATVFLYGTSYEEIDLLSSGRLSLYELEITKHIPEGDALDWLMGSDTFLGGERTLVVDEISTTARFERTRQTTITWH